ncbi:hypothetical protein JST97_09200 [bacterium]|nr:hypothetical protein [bacterium]
MAATEWNWAQLDVSENLQVYVRACLERYDLSPSRVDLGGNIQLAWSFSSDLPPAPLCAEFLAHQVVSEAPFPVHFCLGKRLPEDCQAWIDVGAFRPLQANPRMLDARLLQEGYESSGLFQFHRHYFAQDPHTPEHWAQTYGLIVASAFPHCIAPFLQDDYKGWQEDAGLRHFIRGLLSLGWHPRHVAGVMAPRLGSWEIADLAARCSAGLLQQGLDQLEGFDCASVCRLGYCPPQPRCPQSLEDLRGHLSTGSWQP